MDIRGDRHRLQLEPPPLPRAPLDPTEALLDTAAGRVVEARAGDASSLLGIVGAAVIFVNHRGRPSPALERAGERIVTASMSAAGVDAAIQARNVLAGDDDAGSSWGSVAYAATGMIPGASLRALKGLHRHPTRQELAALAALGANGAMVGYELSTRGSDMATGREDASGYASAAASLGGFVVAHRYLLRR